MATAFVRGHRVFGILAVELSRGGLPWTCGGGLRPFIPSPLVKVCHTLSATVQLSEAFTEEWLKQLTNHDLVHIMLQHASH